MSLLKRKRRKIVVHSRQRQLIGLLFAIAFLGCSSAHCSDDKTIDFERDIAPILATQCLECHDSVQKKGKLDLSDVKGLRKGGDSGTVVVAHKPKASLLWQRVEQGEMPPKTKLSKDEKRKLYEWIQAGAVWGTPGEKPRPIDRFRYSSKNRAGYDWWSLQPLKPVRTPIVDTTWPRTDIDRFVLQRLLGNGLAPSPKADPRQLVRRLYHDLTGLPPIYEVVEKFAAAPTEAAYEKLVDQILESPEYGEHWARHWLDVARFGESHGYEYNAPRDNAWHYRDWVIRALNDDMPYDQFTRMQIAGDIIRPESSDGLAAVGFLVGGVHNTVLGKSDAMRRASRHEELEEIIGTMSQAFLGLTANCARCHDHKFDPIRNREYYQLAAALAGVRHGSRDSTSAISEAKARQLQLKHQEILDQLQDSVDRRGKRLSNTANVMWTTVKGLTKGERYTVKYEVSPTVYGVGSLKVNQDTNPADGVLVRILNVDDSELAARFSKPGAWRDLGSRQVFSERSFEFSATADSIKVWIGSNVATGRFGGAIDNLAIVDGNDNEVFVERFDEFHGNTGKAIQANTQLKVFWGMKLDRWKSQGVNVAHAVEYEPGNFAAQIFSGWRDAKPKLTEAEQLLAKKITDIESRLAKTSIFTVVASKPQPMRILVRGDATNLGDEVSPGGIASVAGLTASFNLPKNCSDSERRRRLAEWLTHQDNGPFHRTIVNRVWHYYFGQGIVNTPNDLGFNGGRATHPQLLEWLALWFQENGYSLKKLHKLVVMSAVYQQTSIANAEQRRQAEQIDKGNRLLWLQNSKRIEGEVLRDTLLAQSNLLNRKRFGPGYRDVQTVTVGSARYYLAIDPIGSEFNRRTIYRWRARGERSSLLETFDCPDPSATTPTRNVTTTPSQSLSQWNHGIVLRAAAALAKDIKNRNKTGSTDDLVVQVWRRILMRNPDSREKTEAIKLVEKHGLPLLCRVVFNSNEVILID